MVLVAAGDGPEPGPPLPVAGGVGKLRAYAASGFNWPDSAAADTFKGFILN